MATDTVSAISASQITLAKDSALGTSATVETSIDRELRRMYLEQGRRPPLYAWLMFVPLFWSGREHVPAQALVTWFGIFYLLVLFRWLVCRIDRSESSRPDLVLASRLVLVLRCGAAFTLGVGALLWFGQLPVYERLLFMMCAVGWYATTVLASVAKPAGAWLFGISLFGPIIVAWSQPTSPQNLIVAFLCIIIFLMERRASGALHQVVRESIASRLRERDLAGRLEQHGNELERVIQEKSMFLAAASHDLRQPVTSMNLLLSALQASSDEATLRRIAAKLEAPLNALEDVLTSILEVSRLEAGVIEVNLKGFEISQLLDPLVAEYQTRAASKGLNLQYDRTDLHSFTDPELLRRVVRNLLDNAIKFTDSGVVGLEVSAEGGCLVLAVRDSGPGIADDQRGKVFSDYFQGDNTHRDRRQGLGLGLGIVRRLVALLGGEISLASRLGHGSCFTIRLPNSIISEQQHNQDEPRLEGLLAPIPIDSVLVVEDDQLVVDALATVFETLGVTAAYASSGDDALMKTALGRFIPQLAMVDYGLPGNFDGITLIGHLRVRFPNCKFLLVTGDTSAGVLRRATDADLPVLHKPITIGRLSDKLAEMGIA